MFYSCPKCQSADLRKLKRNSLENNPGYICNSCGAKLRDSSAVGTLYTYITIGIVFALLGAYFGAVWSVVAGVGAALYGAFRLRRPVAVSKQQLL